MKFGIFNLVPATEPFERWLEFTRLAEASGFQHISVGDTPVRVMDASVTLTLLATHTSRVRFGPTISNPITRHPAVAAATYASLQALSGSRAFFGVGTGNSALRNLGMPPSTLAHLEAFVQTFRDLVTTGHAEFEGRPCVVPWAPEAAPEGVPVVMAANGPRSLELAGRIADGVIVGGGITPEVVEATWTRLERGTSAAGRQLDDIDVWFQADIWITDEEDPVGPMKDILASIGSRNFRATLEAKAVPDELVPAIRGFERDYAYAEHISQGNHNGALLDRHGLTDFFARRWLVAGTADQVAARLRELEASGVRQLHLPGLVPDPFRVVERLRDEVIPSLAPA